MYIVRSEELEIKSRNGNRARSTCPVCSGTRGEPNDPSVALELSTGVGYCHHCGARFKIDDNPDNFDSRYGVRRGRQNGCEEMKAQLLPADEETMSYMRQRGISEKTVRAACVCSRVEYRGGVEMHWAAFPFVVGHNVVNVQYKLADMQQKQFFFEQGGMMVPWNADSMECGDGHGALYITEGMMDALALMECGVEHVVSVPNGAGSRLDCFDMFRDKIKKGYAYIVFAGDTDEQGLKLRENVRRYFNDMDVCSVKWKNGGTEAKDADEMLMQRGRDAVNACLSAARNEGDERLLITGSDDTDIDELFREGMPSGNGIGLEEFDKIVRFEPGNLLLVTGYPGSGKSSLVNFIVTRLLVMYGWRTMFFSPEKMPQKYHDAELISLMAGKKFDRTRMSQAEFNAAKNRLQGNIVHVIEEVSELKDIIVLAERAVRVNGIRVLVIDPFVYLSMPAIPGASETQKIAEMLKDIMLATRRLNLITILVAHPRKPQGDMSMEPSLYEVAGSANFYNFCDSGIIMERDRACSRNVKITCGKARREFLGRTGMVKLAFDSSCGRYALCVKSDGGTYSTEHYAFDRKSWALGGEAPAEGRIDFGSDDGSFENTPGLNTDYDGNCDDLPF